MWFLTTITYVSISVQLVFITVSIAAGLYYLAEMVEEHTVLTKKLITWLNSGALMINVLLWLLEGFPTVMSILCILSQLNHFAILQNFPYISFSSPTFLIAIAFILTNHYMAFQFFGSVYFGFTEVMAYFTLCLWVVPFTLFVSLSANDNVLPTTTEKIDGDVVTNYFMKRGKKSGLLSLFNYAKDSLLPTQRKKGY